MAWFVDNRCLLSKPACNSQVSCGIFCMLFCWIWFLIKMFTVLLKMLMNELLSVVSVVMLVSMTESSFKNCWRPLLNLTSLTLPPNETSKVYTDPLAYVICCSWPHIGAKNTLVYTLYKYIGLPRCLQLVHLVLGTLTIVANAYPVQLYPQYWHSFSVKLELPVYALCV